MSEVTPGPKLLRFKFYVATATLAVVIGLIQGTLGHYFEEQNKVLGSSSADNTIQWTQMAVQIDSDETTLLTTLATALLGGLGWLLVNRGKNRPKLRHRWSALLSAAGAGISLYYGYVKRLYLLSMVADYNFDAQLSVIGVPRNIQFYALLAGFFFLADFVFHDFLEET